MDLLEVTDTAEGASYGPGIDDTMSDSEGYCRLLRMDVPTFEELVVPVSPSIERKNTSMRNAIPVVERIALTLRYLATDETQFSLRYQFRIVLSTVSRTIPAVCAAIYHHIGSETVDANLKFLYVDVRTIGRVSDGRIRVKSKLKQVITNGELNIPEAAAFPGSASEVPLWLMIPNIMKLYRGTNLNKDCLIDFHTLGRFQKMHFTCSQQGTAILTSVPNSKLIVLATCSLDKFLSNRSKNLHNTKGCADREDTSNGVMIEGNWRQNTTQLISCQRISSRGYNHAKEVRDRFYNFFLMLKVLCPGKIIITHYLNYNIPSHQHLIFLPLQNIPCIF
ncbi:protein ALP1-like [Trichonephila inaurata madagascariensis]|uniref:Protein ALP1-like n=1 Tax=Trichonephila inaurata madagascariensis TaxID=2747483 RepID=A0A8X7CB31_9ARAC|nr:protein ALP1-like [Trichonephila inaurata madagascariensis]